MPKAYFAHKAPNLEDARAQIRAAKASGVEPTVYFIAAEMQLSNPSWQNVADTLLHDRRMFAEYSANEPACQGLAIPCIRLVNAQTHTALIIDTEGYPYARYTAIEGFEIDEDEDNEPDEPEIDEETLQYALRAILIDNRQPEDESIYATCVQTFNDAGVMTYNKGLVITLADGSEFQLTIVQSR